MSLSVNRKLALILEAGSIHNASDFVAGWRGAGRDAAPFSACAAMIQDESWGVNEYGADSGAGWVNTGPFGELSEHAVTAENFAWFWQHVCDGATSDGVGPAQLTSPDLIAAANTRGGAWIAQHNFAEGFLYLGGLIRDEGSIEGGFTRYNGSPVYGARVYGVQQEWHARLVKAGLA